MSKRIKRLVSPPTAWEGCLSDPVFHRDTGEDVVLQGSELRIEGTDVAPLWRWFDQSQSIWAEPVAYLVCDIDRTRLGTIERVWQPGRDPVARITYQQRRLLNDGSEMNVFRALLHRPSEHCSHGALVMHPADSIEIACRSHGVLLPGHRIVDAVKHSGGWVGDVAADPPQPRRVGLR